MKGIFNKVRNDQTFSDIKLVCDNDFAKWSPLPTKLCLLPPPNSSASFLLDLTNRTSYYTSEVSLTSSWPCSWTSSILANWMCWKTTLTPSCRLPATSRLKGSHQPRPSSKSSQVFRLHMMSWYLAHSFPPLLSRLQLLLQSKLQLLLQPLLTLTNGQLLHHQPLTYTIQKLVLKKIRDSEGKRGVECVLCGKRLFGGSAIMEHDMLLMFTSMARDGKPTAGGYIIVTRKPMARNWVLRNDNLVKFERFSYSVLTIEVLNFKPQIWDLYCKHCVLYMCLIVVDIFTRNTHSAAL